ncbi:hypothetical protein BDN71DRAFT_1437525 [Pleurotus eryngii]|uniref:Uncharacterized protein n=1 Tax=Pleurotus eryngii TaxID=5323 RepID=A0A9P6A9H9_PLEER|nr:hypothetical protein BDN71DRAFT_1437525 [Pleurotus eryngii]
MALPEKHLGPGFLIATAGGMVTDGGSITSCSERDGFANDTALAIGFEEGRDGLSLTLWGRASKSIRLSDFWRQMTRVTPSSASSLHTLPRAMSHHSKDHASFIKAIENESRAWAVQRRLMQNPSNVAPVRITWTYKYRPIATTCVRLGWRVSKGASCCFCHIC